MTLSKEEKKKRAELKNKNPYIYNKIIKFDEKIARGETIAILQFQYGYQCNFHCEHCCTSKMEKKKRVFTIPDVAELARQADEMGLANFTVTGGEPLLFPDLDEVIKAIDPNKFYISLDTNGWFLDDDKAKHLKDIGIRKVHISLNSLYADEHDYMVHQPGSYARVLRAIDSLRKINIPVLINTVVTKERVRSYEFEGFLKFTKRINVPVIILLAKPAGSWAGRKDITLDMKDLAHIKELEGQYNAFTHLVPCYGLDIGCIAMKRLTSITRYGDVMPCPWIHISIGNFFKEPLKDIFERGLKIKWFGKRQDICLSSVEGEFLNNYINKIEGQPYPVPWDEVFKKGDFIE